MGRPDALDEAPLPRGLEAVRGQRLAAVDEGELRRRAAHVEGEEIAAAVRRAEEGGGDARRRPGPTRASCTGARWASATWVSPAAGEHEQERRGDAETGELSGHHRQVVSGRVA